MASTNRIAAAVVAAAVVGVGAGAGAVAIADRSSGDTTTAAATTTAPTVSNVANSTLTIGAVAKAALPSVVEIDVATGGSSATGGGASAEGTGWVYDTKGDLVTNYHVVQGASSVNVKFSDGSSYKGTIVGTDPDTDLAVVRVNAPAAKLVPLQLGDSDAAQLGDPVIAIGNPFGLDGTVTSGIVSQLNREITSPNQTPIEGAIQTDAAINHGNSGGPLLNLDGRVIGVTAQIQSDSGGNEGVGFAIPSNLVRTIATQLIASGKAEHALLGIIPANVSSGGAKVQTVSPNTAAKDAGVKVGDVITAVDGQVVTSAAQLRALIGADAPGDKVTLTITRAGAQKTIDVTLGTRS